jgi:hypothetical protein
MDSAVRPLIQESSQNKAVVPAPKVTTTDAWNKAFEASSTLMLSPCHGLLGSILDSQSHFTSNAVLKSRRLWKPSPPRHLG